MLVLKVGKVKVQGLGVTLTQDSSQEDLARALEHEPKLDKYIEKTAKNGKTKEN